MLSVIDPIDREIIRAVDQAARDGVKPIYPHQVVAWLPVCISDRAVRSRMAKMADHNVLLRHGVYGGYSAEHRVLNLYDFAARDMREVQLRDALARAERALKEAQMLAAELAGLEYAIGEVA